MLVPVRPRLLAGSASCVLLLLLLVAVLVGVLAAPPAGALVGGTPVAGDEEERISPEVAAAVVPIRHRGQYICTGTLVAPDRILAAGHCGHTMGAEGATPELRDLAGFEITVAGQTYRVLGTREKPGYDTAAWYHPDNDAMVFVLDRPVPDVTPLRVGSAPASGRLTHVSWGSTSRQHPDAGGQTLSYLRCSVMTPETYQQRGGEASAPPAGMAYTKCPVNSTVGGDSGSPVLQLDDEGRATVVSVLSSAFVGGDSVLDGFSPVHNVRLDWPDTSWFDEALTFDPTSAPPVEPAPEVQSPPVVGPRLRDRIGRFFGRLCCPVG